MPEQFVGGYTPQSIFNMAQAVRAGLDTPGTGGGGGTTPQSLMDMYGGGTAGLEQLTSFINNLNLTAQQNANAARIPGAAGLEGISSGNIGAELRGQVPGDVINLLGQQAAERGIATGTQGAPISNAAYLRGLGLTSLDLQRRGQADLTAALGRNPGAPLINPLGLLSGGSASSRSANYPMVRETGGGGGYTIMPGGGGGGRGGMPAAPTYGAPSGPTGEGLFNWYGGATGGGGIPTGNFEANVGYESNPYAPGYQDVSSGSMFMGTPTEYDASIYDPWGYWTGAYSGTPGAETPESTTQGQSAMYDPNYVPGTPGGPSTIDPRTGQTLVGAVEAA